MSEKKKSEPMKRLSMTREEFLAVLKDAAERVRKWPPLRNPRSKP